MKENLAGFLKSEYEKKGAEVESISLHGKKYIIPYPYMSNYLKCKKQFTEKYGGQTDAKVQEVLEEIKEECQKKFLDDFFDIMRRDYQAYKKHNLFVQYISWHDNDKHRKLVVPYDLRNKQVSPQEVANRIFKRAEKKYIKAVSLSQYLAEAYPERPYQTLISIARVRDMQKARYEYQLKLARDKAIYITKKVGNFLAQNAVKATNNLKNLDIDTLKVKARRWAVGVMLTTTITGAVYTAFQIKDKKEEQKEQAEQRQFKDPMGHVRMFSRCHDAIKTSLAFAENFAGEAFKDGVGMPTIGYGCTYYLDENGNGSRKTTPVKMGDTMTVEEADVQKERYLQFEILKQIQENVKVPMDEATMVATCNFAYVIGSTNFRKSEYLKALNKGEKGEDLARYLTGYRVQKGLLSRFYFMGALLKGDMKVSDLMDLTAEGCYNLKPKDVCVYEGRKLKLDKDGFAYFRFDNLENNLNKAKKTRYSAACRGKKCPKVRDILPQSVIDGVAEMEKSGTYTGVVGDLILAQQGRTY